MRQCLRRKAKPYRQRLTAETRGRINDRVLSMSAPPSLMRARGLATGRRIPLSVSITSKRLSRSLNVNRAAEDETCG